MKEETNKTEEFLFGPNVKVTSDKRSGSKVISLPFDFPDETRGILIVCRVKDEEWVPMNDIKSIKIEYK